MQPLMLPLVALATVVSLAAALPGAHPAQDACPQSPAAALAADIAGSFNASTAVEVLHMVQRHGRALLAKRGAVQSKSDQGLVPIAFVKTHKTGGSTAVNILHRVTYARNLSIIPPNDGGVVNWRTFLEREPPAHQYDVLCNHAIFNETAAKAYLKASPLIFSIVREPMATLESNFRWKAYKHPDNLYDRSSWAGRLVEMKGIKKQKYMNPMARDLGWYDGIDLRREDPESDAVFRRDNDTEAVASFIRRLDAALDFVFPTEHYDEGLLLLRRRLNLSLADVTYMRMKETDAESLPIPPPTAEEREQLNEFLSVDFAVYDFFSKRFQRDWEAAGGDKVLGPELEELRRRNAELTLACAMPRDERVCPWMFVADNGVYQRMGTLRAQLQAVSKGHAFLSQALEHISDEELYKLVKGLTALHLPR